MNTPLYIAYAAAAAATSLALAVPLWRRGSVAAWSFFAGMLLLAAESVVSGIGARQLTSEQAEFWEMIWLGVKSLLPSVWLLFSLTYSRGNYREFLARSRLLLAAALIVPVTTLLVFHNDLVTLTQSPNEAAWIVRYTAPAKILTAILLLASVVILMNLEKTLRAAVGTMQWRVKFVVLGLALIFGARIYTRSQALIYAADTSAATGIEAASLLIGCLLIVIGSLRGGFGEIDIYPSRAALHTSITMLLTGAYLLVVGVLAQLVARTSIASSFQLAALLILLGLTVLAVLLVSDRMRERIRRFISRHFERPQHDFRDVWSRFTNATGTLADRRALCAAAAKLVSETFNALSISVWVYEQRTESLLLSAATTDLASSDSVAGAAIVEALKDETRPFDLDRARGGWAAALRSGSQPQFAAAGARICVPLSVADQTLGCMILADRVNGVRYTEEEFDLLKCIGDQLAASLLNLRLTEEVMVGKELAAFQTMSTFFVHDLKNAASTLTLMLQNLPVHFQDPAFREDALRGIGRTADRINQMINSLSIVRQQLAVNPSEFDLNQLMEEAIQTLNGTSAIELVRHLQPLPKVKADREQLQSVVTNLLLNARDAVADKGTVTIETERQNGWASISVTDSGCGMSPTFLRDSLFRPFCTTKKKGLGIGMFQSKMIVEAHGGRIQVTSELGKGTTFRVFLPLNRGGN